MKSQTQHIGNYSNVFDYSPFGTPLDGRTVENVFSQLKADTIVVTDTLFIINNDFENAVIEPNGAGVKIDGWTHYSPSTTLSVEPHNGSDWLKVVSTNGTHGAHQGFSVEPGESYTFEIDLHRPAGMNKEINVVIWKNIGSSGALSVHVLNVDGTNTFTYNVTSSDIFIQIRQAGTYYLDNIRMYRTYEDTMFVSGYEVDRAYRYGFNSMERDNEIKGKGNSYDFGARLYDPRVGRWLSVDPLASKYPDLSPYNFVANNPILFIDPNGKEIIINYKDENGEIQSYKYGSDIEVPNNTFVKETIKALNEINSRPQVREDFDFLAKTEDYIIEINQRNYTIARPQIGRWQSYEGEDVYSASKYQTVVFNEKLGLQEISTGKINLPFISLWHELGHILNAIKDPESFDKRTKNIYKEGHEKEKWSDEEEEFNIENNEHRIIDSNKNEFKRTTHKEGDKSGVKIIFIESSESSKNKKQLLQQINQLLGINIIKYIVL